jgi:thiol-disulfide isomerase/thioredoxin
MKRLRAMTVSLTPAPGSSPGQALSRLRERGTQARCASFTLTLCLLYLACLPAYANGFSLTDLDGKSHKLEGYKGKWVLVNFWATWCPPCLEEIPDLIALHESKRNIAVIGIALDSNGKKEIREFADDNLMSYPLALGDEKLVSQFGKADVLPSTFIYNPQGKLVKVHRGLITKAFVEKLIRAK